MFFKNKLNSFLLKRNLKIKSTILINCTIDNSSWEHPFLSYENIKEFRKYSQEVWEFANE